MINLHLDNDIKTLPPEEAKKKIDGTNQVAEHFCSIKNYKDSRYCAENACEMASAINYRKGIADAKFIMGLIYVMLEDFAAAIKILTESEKIYEEIGDLKGIGKTCSKIGFSYLSIGDYSNEIEAFFKAAGAFNKTGMIYDEANALNVIGNYYLMAKEFDSALEYHKLSLKLKKSLRDVYGIIFSLYNIALTYNNEAAEHEIVSESTRNLYNKALKYYQAALDFNTKLEQNEFLENRILQNIGLTYTNLNRNEEAIELFLKNIKYFTRIKNEADKTDVLIYLALAYRELKRMNEAEEILNQAKEIAERLNLKRLIKLVSQHMAVHFAAVKDFKSALNYQRKYSALELERSKTLTEDNIRKLNILHSVDITKKETEILTEKNEQLKSVNKELIKLNDEKNYFLNIAANDLKVPLEKINEKIYLIRDGEKKERYKKLTEVLIESSHMQSIISDLLIINESESAK